MGVLRADATLRLLIGRITYVYDETSVMMPESHCVRSNRLLQSLGIVAVLLLFRS